MSRARTYQICFRSLNQCFCRGKTFEGIRDLLPFLGCFLPGRSIEVLSRDCGRDAGTWKGVGRSGGGRWESGGRHHKGNRPMRPGY